MSTLKKIFQTKLIKQILKFVVIGGIAFAIDYALLYICTEFLDIYYLISSIISFTVSVIFNYIASIKWVFKVDEKQNKKYQFILFIILSIIGLVINQIIMWITVEQLGIFYMFSKLFATFIVMVWNFISRKLFLEEKN